MLNAMLYSLRSRLVALVGLALFPGLVLTVLLSRQQQDAALRSVEQQNLSVLRLVAMSQSQLVNTTRTLLLTLSNTWVIRNRNLEGCTTLLSTTLNSSTVFSSVVISGLDGVPWCQAPPSDAPQDNRTSTFFRDTLGKREFVVGGVQINALTKRPNLIFAYPVYSATNEVIGVVSAEVDLGKLNASIGTLNLPAGYVVDIIDRSGTFVVRYPQPDEYVGKSFRDSAITQQILAQANVDEPISTEMDGVEGTRRLYAFTEVEGTPNRDLFVNVGIAPELAYTSANQSMRQTLVALGIFSVLAVSLSWLAGGVMVVAPIKSIGRAAKAIASGDLSARANLPAGQSELDLLAHNFDEMAVRLEQRSRDLAQSNAVLEERVRVRTDQLQVLVAKLRESREQLRNLSAQQRRRLEEEQARLSREVHDQIGQALAGLKMDLVALERRAVIAFNGEVPLSVSEKLESMELLINSTIKNTRAIYRGLRPSLLDDLGLDAAIEWYAQDFRDRTGIVCVVSNKNRVQLLDNELATVAYRIFQEAMTNVVQHSGATQVDIELHIGPITENPALLPLPATSNAFYLSIHDNGKGVTPAQIDDPRSLGILSMRERAIEWNGLVEFESDARKGTTVKVSLPLYS